VSLAASLDRFVRSVDRMPEAKRPKLAPPRPPAEVRAALDGPLFREFSSEARDEIAAWFSAHDGQTDFASPRPGENRILLSLAGALDTAQRIEALSPIPPSRVIRDLGPYVPLLESHGGDNVLYRARSRSLVIWYHDDADSGAEVAPSLQAWLDETSQLIADALPELERQADREQRLRASRWVETEPFAAVKLAAKRAALEKYLAALPVGAALMRIRNDLIRPHLNVRLFVKRDRISWLVASGPDKACALDELSTLEEATPNDRVVDDLCDPRHAARWEQGAVARRKA